MLTLKIELKSDLCSSSGLGQSGIVDRDIVYDDLGLPVIPGRRLKGLLRDAYLEISPWVTEGSKLVDEVFGKGGDSKPGVVTVFDAVPQDYTRLRAWLERIRTGPRATVLREDVLDAVTSQRRQTQIDRQTGAALENTLRLSRVVPANTKPATTQFEARILINSSAPAAQIDALKKAAKALKQMGSSRTRGLGRVKCWVEAGEEPTGTSKGETNQPDHSSGILVFEVTLTSPALFPNHAGDPNTVVGLDYIPGSALLGLFASLWPDKNDEFLDFFFSGKLRFLAAYPVIEGVRSVPIPHTHRESKSWVGTYHDVACEWPEEPVKRTHGWCEGRAVVNGSGALCEVEKRFSYHHQRSDDRRIGRAIGSEVDPNGPHAKASAGALFTYEAIAARQKFEGAVLGEPEVLKRLTEYFAAVKAVKQLGRSKSAEFGGGIEWEWRNHENGRETLGWGHGAEERENGEATQKVRVVLLSPLTWVNPQGHPGAHFPLEQLQEKLGAGKLSVIAEYSRTRLLGGYLAHQGLPRQQLPCLEAGSVVVLESEKPVTREVLTKAEAFSYGMRVQEGFGRIALEMMENASRSPELKPVRAAASGSAAIGERESPEYKLAAEVFEKAVFRQAEILGERKAAERPENSKQIPNSQLSRLLLMMEQTPPGDLKTRIGAIKEKGRKSLGDVYKFVCAQLANQELPQDIVTNVLDAPRWSWSKVFSQTGQPEMDPHRIRVRYLSAYLKGLVLQNRSRQ